MLNRFGLLALSFLATTACVTQTKEGADASNRGPNSTFDVRNLRLSKPGEPMCLDKLRASVEKLFMVYDFSIPNGMEFRPVKYNHDNILHRQYLRSYAPSATGSLPTSLMVFQGDMPEGGSIAAIAYLNPAGDRVIAVKHIAMDRESIKNVETYFSETDAACRNVAAGELEIKNVFKREPGAGSKTEIKNQFLFTNTACTYRKEILYYLNQKNSQVDQEAVGYFRANTGSVIPVAYQPGWSSKETQAIPLIKSSPLGIPRTSISDTMTTYCRDMLPSKVSTMDNPGLKSAVQSYNQSEYDRTQTTWGQTKDIFSKTLFGE